MDKSGNMSFEADAFGNANRVLVVSGVCIAKLTDVLLDKVYKSWRTFATASTKYAVTTTSIARMGDEVWIVTGAKWPFVLRQEQSGMRILLAPAMLYETARGASVGPVLESCTGLSGQRSGIMSLYGFVD
jgi:hypothetical protein